MVKIVFFKDIPKSKKYILYLLHTIYFVKLYSSDTSIVVKKVTFMTE